MQDMSADEVIGLLGLQPHPEGGWFRETFRDAARDLDRGHSTAIYYLLKAGEYSHWHRVDAAEVWHWYGGGAFALTLSPGFGEGAPGAGAERLMTTHHLGSDLAAGERPQIVVPAGHWQAARVSGPWALAGCTVAPGFQFSGFEMAPPDWPRPAE